MSLRTRVARGASWALAIALVVAVAPPATAGDVRYLAGAASADVTPIDWQEERYWLAGFGVDRWAESVHDPLLARVLVLDDGSAGVAIVTLDLLGVCSNDIRLIRDAVEASVPAVAGRVLVHSTHSHEGPDTIGLWGGRGDVPFLNPRPLDYIELIADRAAAAALEAWTARREVSVTFAELDNGRFADLFTDSRDPQVSDPFARLIVLEALDGGTVATLVNWASHPEVLGDENTALTADYPKWVADEIEEQEGGRAMLVNGAIGGLLSSGSDSIFPDLPPDSFEKAEAIGREVGARFLEGLREPGEGERVETFDLLPPMTWRSRTYYVPVENPLYLIAQPLGRIPKDLFFQFEIPEAERWRPDWQIFAVYTDFEASVLTLGPATVLTMGGELYPELLVGGVEPLGDPPYVDEPAEPPLVDNPVFAQAEYQFFFGLTNDFTGYVVPVQQWDGWYGGEYGEEFATSWDEAQIMSWNLHLLLAGFESFEYPAVPPPFLPRPNRDRPTTDELDGAGEIDWRALYRASD